MAFTTKILLLGSGELGKEFAISAKRLGAYVIACDSYSRAPAMQVSDEFEVFSMLDGDKLRETIAKHDPDFIVPEIEAIRTEILAEVEAEGRNVVPSSRATQMTMNRDAIRDLAAQDLGVRTSEYRYAESFEEVETAAEAVGFPAVIKPVMSSSGKGQSTVHEASELQAAWDYATSNMRGDRSRVIFEQFIDFDYEITLLTVRTRDGVVFCPPIGHRQERGDYQESWQPAPMDPAHLAEAQAMAKTVVDDLGGYGLFGVEFFVASDGVIFSELSPRPHDTGMVTLISQYLNEFDLHARAIMGLPIPEVTLNVAAGASAVILAEGSSETFSFAGLDEALQSNAVETRVDVRLFGKPVTRPYRRMGVALAAASNIDAAREAARESASRISIIEID